MSYQISDEEIAAVSALAGPERYSHFIRRVADWEEVWGLKDEGGWVLMHDNDGRRIMPFWPHVRYAEVMATGVWESCKPAGIALADFLEAWLPGMSGDGLYAAVLPTPALRGVVVEPLRLRNDLDEELSQYE